MKPIDLLIQEGEGLSIEFKEKFTPRISQDIVGFANAKGGTILLGVSDNGEVVGEELSNKLKSQILDLARNCKPSLSIEIEKHNNQVIGIKVPEGADKPYACGDGFFKRFDGVTQKLSPEEVRQIFKNLTSINYESFQRDDAGLESLSIEKINSFLKSSKSNLVITKKNLKDFLESIKLYSQKSLNNAALLMFAKNIEKYIYHSQLFLVAYKGTEGVHIYDKKYVRSDLLTQYQEALLFCEKHLNVRTEFENGRRKDLFEIPLSALRETIANAIIHRDYSMSGTNIQIEVHQDRVVISNPGGLPEGMSLAKLGSKSFRRNEIIADMFSRMNLAERFGSGIKRVKALMREAGGEPPHYESDSFFTVTLMRPDNFGTNDAISRDGSMAKSNRITIKNAADKILRLLKNNPQYSQQDLAQLVNLTLDGVRYHIKNLQKQKRIKRVGSKKTGSWKVLPGRKSTGEKS